MLSNDNSINNSTAIPYSTINPNYLNARRNLLQIIKSLNTKQYFSSRTYYTAVLYIDYYFLINNVNPYKFSDLLLISLCALILSAKYFEIDSRFPDIKKFIYIISHITKHRYTFTLNDVLKGEVCLLKCLQYQLQYHSLYSYTIFYFCHGIIFHNDSFLTAHELNAPSNEAVLNKFLEKVYIHARELMDYIVHQGNFVCLGNDCHLSAVAILVKVLSVIKGCAVNEACDLFGKVYNVDVGGTQFKNIYWVIEEMYAKMEMMKEKVKKINVNRNNNVSYLNIEMDQKRKSDCNESMLMVMVPELRESSACEGDKIFMKLLEEDVLFFNREDEDNFKKRKRALSASYESALTKMMLSESSSNLQMSKYHKDSCHLITHTNLDEINKDSRTSLNSSTNENVRKNAKSFTYSYDINEFKNHIAKYKKNQSDKKKKQSNEIAQEQESQKINNSNNIHNVQNTSVNMKRYHNNNNANKNYNYDVNNMNSKYCNNYYGNMNNNNVYSDYVNKLNYYQQLQHNTIIINNNIHINNYANNNNNKNNNNQFANYVNMNLPIMNNNNINNCNQTIYYNNNFTPNQNNNLQFANFPQQHQQQQPLNYYQYNNYYQQYNPPIQKNINFNYKVNSYPMNNNNITPYSNPQYFYNKHY